MAQYVDLGAVANGCRKIDSAIDKYQNVISCIENATSYLDHNNLRFGQINSSLDEQLDTLKSQIAKFSDMNSGVTSTITANAQAQYEEYQAWLRALEEANRNRRISKRYSKKCRVRCVRKSGILLRARLPKLQMI